MSNDITLLTSAEASPEAVRSRASSSCGVWRPEHVQPAL